ncbi:MAG: hypothetical protein KME16_14990 [Scytolyngbya sp. HA4215-MV1]|jgi:hypothetical protein|nr:hypothetical protein [Scytolyngbya sp. HA4215-MV1]
MGEPHPTGQYLVTFPGEPTQKWTVPQWMLSDLNQFGQPDPVLWVLNRIPELKSGYEPPKTAQAHPAPTQQQRNQQALVRNSHSIAQSWNGFTRSGKVSLNPLRLHSTDISPPSVVNQRSDQWSISKLSVVMKW